MSETWTAIAGFDGVYEVSDRGRVKRILTSAGARAGRVLIPQAMKRGYLRVTLWKGGEAKRFLLHRLVALNFIGNSPLQINHKDGDKNNNAVFNLEFVSPKENIHHAMTTGLRDTRGEKNSQAKLNDKTVRMIRRSSLSGYRLAKQLNVTQRVISLIRRGLAWEHVV